MMPAKRRRIEDITVDSAPIGALPDDLLVEIFAQCDGDTLFQLNGVCRRWRKVLLSGNVWRTAALRDFDDFLSYVGFPEQHAPSCWTQMRTTVDPCFWRSFWRSRRFLLSEELICIGEVENNQQDAVELAVRRTIDAVGGVLSQKITSSVTLLISSTFNSSKSRKANELGIPVVKSTWLYDVVLKGLHLPLKPYLLPPLAGLVITVTGLSIESRLKIETLCLKCGATYCADLIRSHTTHLISSVACGDKYMWAKRWQIPVVWPTWFSESIQVGRCLDEKKYSLDNISRHHPRHRLYVPTSL